MLRLVAHIRALLRNENGHFAALFGLLAISLTATAGAVVDFVSVQNYRSVVQHALDTTALALQPQINEKTEAELLVMAQDIIDEVAQTNGLPVTIEEATEVESEGTLFLRARMEVPLHFVALVGVDSMATQVASQVTKKSLAQEIVFVLDNSGSMGWYSRMSNLKTAATNATNILMDAAGPSNPVSIGIVPFTEFVNVGTANASASWIDALGESDIANDNFDDDNNDSTPFTGTVNRFALYSSLTYASWGGCVEARPHYSTGSGAHLDTDDTTPTSANKNTLFVPLFAPDEPSGSYSYDNSYISDTPYACTGTSYYDSYRERQERLCKYNTSSYIYGDGPNADCPASAILPLTGNKSSVLSAISGMNADGGTNIHMGTIWGFRVLSPTEPFTEGDSYDLGNLSKIMIIMTDGENTHPSSGNMNGSRWYTAYGYPVNGRLGAWGWSTSQLQGEMDNRTEASCASAKAEGITIYTIGLDPPNSSTRNMLTACATSPSHAYFPSDPSDLNDVFTTIANEIQSARIAQ